MKTLSSVEDHWGLRSLPLLLSLIAGSVDVIGFLWHGTFVAHITGNLILVAARVVAGTPVGLATVLSVPVFIVMLALSNTAAVWLESAGIPSLWPLLGAQFVFLACFFAVGTITGTHGSPDSVAAVIALMLGVCGLATQNVLVQASIRGAPSTAVMTTNLTRFMHDLNQLLFGKDAQSTGAARERIARTWPTIVGFAGGAAAGAALYAGAGIDSLALPTALALIALGLPVRLRSTRTGRRVLGEHLQERSTRRKEAVLRRSTGPRTASDVRGRGQGGFDGVDLSNRDVVNGQDSAPSRRL